MYTTDPNNAKKQVPKARSVDAYGRATQPGPQVLSDRPNYVLVNVEHGTKYEFLYESGGTYVDYGIVAADGPLRININPIAWKGGAGTTGHVSFVYEGGLK